MFDRIESEQDFVNAFLASEFIKSKNQIIKKYLSEQQKNSLFYRVSSDCFLKNQAVKKLIDQIISQKQISSRKSKEKNQLELFFRKFSAKLICNRQKA
jgi:hypothetical protein